MAKRSKTPSRRSFSMSARKSIGKKGKGSSSRASIMRMDAVGKRRFVKNRRNKGTYTTQFRSNIASIARFFDSLHLRDVHVECLKNTPFYNFIYPFIKGKITAGSIHGMQEGTVMFFMTYNKDEGDEGCFVLGTKKLRIDPVEFDLIFGIRSGDKEIDMTKSSAMLWDLPQRKFSHLPKINLNHIS